MRVGRGGFACGCTRLHFRGRGECSEGANEEHEVPALLFGEALLKGGHGFSAFADLVEKLAIGELAHVLRIGEIAGSGIVHLTLRAVAFTGITMTLRAFVEVDRACGFDCRRGRGDGVFELLGFFGNDPFPILQRRENDRNGNQGEDKCKEGFAQSETASQRSCHGNKKILAHPAGQRKTKKKAANERRRERREKKDAGPKAASAFAESREQDMEIKRNGK
jgi:hypothetical protein